MDERAIPEGVATLPAPDRGSRWGLDGVYYPATEERTVPLSGAAIRLIFYLYAALRRLLYPRHQQVYVAADQFIYFAAGDPNRKIAPDVWVCFQVPQEPERAVFRTWEEGATPSFVIEVSSKDSRAEDRLRKLPVYRDDLHCREYLIYDEELDELLLYRREGEEFVLAEAAPDGRVYSQEVDAWFGREPGILVRVYDAAGQPLADMTETYNQADAAAARADAAAARAELEARIRQRAEQEAAAARQQAEAERQRAAAAAAELVRLRAELDALRRERGGA